MKGEKLFEVEKVLLTYENIKEAAVIGVDDSRWGEVGHAFIVTKNNKEFSIEIISEYCEQYLAKYKIPKYFTFLGELPLNSASKIDKRKLLEIHIEQIQNNT